MAMDLINSLNQIDGSDCFFPTTSNADWPISRFSKANKRCDNLTAPERYQGNRFVILTDWRLHDLRRAMGTIIQEELAASPYVIGAILNHSTDKVMGVTTVYATRKMMAGVIKPLNQSCAKDAHDYRLKPEVINATFLYQARMRLRMGEKDCLD